jgi:hypothetical protein
LDIVEQDVAAIARAANATRALRLGRKAVMGSPLSPGSVDVRPSTRPGLDKSRPYPPPGTLLMAKGEGVILADIPDCNHAIGASFG